jgi:hypothetical protein
VLKRRVAEYFQGFCEGRGDAGLSLHDEVTLTAFIPKLWRVKFSFATDPP